MAGKGTPLLRGSITGEGFFVSTRGGGGKKPALDLTPRKHATRLLAQLNAARKTAAARPQRDELAVRELVSVVPSTGRKYVPDPLQDKKGDVRIVGQDPETGVVLLDAPNLDLAGLEKKIREFGEKVRGEAGEPYHLAGIGPVDQIHVDEPNDLLGPRLRATWSDLNDDEVRWFEVACRGGRRARTDDTIRTTMQMKRQFAAVGVQTIEEVLLAEKVVFFARVSVAQLRLIVQRTDCVYELDLAAPPIRAWLAFAHEDPRDIKSLTITPPLAAAPVVVILDSGVSTEHPLLKPAILSAESVVPEDLSPVDVDGHGTQMAGVALHSDLGALIDRGRGEAHHWLQSVKLLRREGIGSASEEYRDRWPVVTERAIEAADREDGRSRVFALALTAELPALAPGRSPPGTTWSDAVDQAAYKGGDGRVICVSIGNMRDEVADPAFLAAYPQLNLNGKLEDPAQAANALTVGAFTEKTTLPPTGTWAVPVAPAGGLSPHSRCGAVDAGPIKPDVVFEGGNIAFDATLPSHTLPDATVPTLVQLTAGHEWPRRPLALHSGTSSATAEASRFVADLFAADASIGPTTARGLVVHSSSWTPAMLSQFPDVRERLAACGYGVPDLSLATECLRDRATVLVEDELPNAVAEEVLKASPPKRATTKSTETKNRRLAKWFRLPVPEDIAEQTEIDVEVRVTLSFFAEPSTLRGRTAYGMMLGWDMQGPNETEENFFKRINKVARGETPHETKTKSFRWEIGIDRRSKGTVQSDRCTCRAADVAGAKLIAVYPRTGWWWRRTDPDLFFGSTKFSLLVTLQSPGLDLTPRIAASLSLPVEVTIH